jgi:FkbM family methyltransferase
VLRRFLASKSTRAVTSVQTPFGPFRAYEDDLITGQLREFGAHTRPEIAFLLGAVEAGDTVFDIGAHIGTFTVPLARRAGSTGTVVAVEPDRQSFGLLVENARANCVPATVVPMNAVVAPAGGGGYRPVFERRNSGATRYAPRRIRLRSLASSALSIDAIAEATGVPDVIKIDVEGLELAILQDSAVVRECRPILYAEVSEPQLRRYGHDIADFARFLQALDYRLFRNIGERNAPHDNFTQVELARLVEGGSFFDVLALPEASSRLSRVRARSNVRT